MDFASVRCQIDAAAETLFRSETEAAWRHSCRPNTLIEFDRSGKAVYNWVLAWNDSGLCGLLTVDKGGLPCVLSDAQIATAVESMMLDMSGS
jgi:hypothetical protein